MHAYAVIMKPLQKTHVKLFAPDWTAEHDALGLLTPQLFPCS